MVWGKLTLYSGFGKIKSLVRLLADNGKKERKKILSANVSTLHPRSSVSIRG
jgi:hypothetical protein